MWHLNWRIIKLNVIFNIIDWIRLQNVLICDVVHVGAGVVVVVVGAGVVVVVVVVTVVVVTVVVVTGVGKQYTGGRALLANEQPYGTSVSSGTVPGIGHIAANVLLDNIHME